MRERRDWDFGFEPFVFWGGRRGRGRRGRRHWFGSGDMKYVILKLLSERPMHGYEVMKELEQQTSGCYKPSPGTVYPTLQWLEDEGLVEGREQDGKKIYAITEAGTAFLDENKSTVEGIFDRVEGMIDSVLGEPMPEINRAMGRLVSRVYRLSFGLGRDDDRRQEIVAILEKALTELDFLAAGNRRGA